jgi:hypothetical protein
MRGYCGTVMVFGSCLLMLVRMAAELWCAVLCWCFDCVICMWKFNVS